MLKMECSKRTKWCFKCIQIRNKIHILSSTLFLDKRSLSVLILWSTLNTHYIHAIQISLKNDRSRAHKISTYTYLYIYLYSCRIPTEGAYNVYVCGTSYNGAGFLRKYVCLIWHEIKRQSEQYKKWCISTIRVSRVYAILTLCTSDNIFP